MDLDGAEGSIRRAATQRPVALRAATTDRATAWWRRVEAERGNAPAPIRALLGGRQRIEVSRAEADAALAWAAALLDSSDEPGFVPLLVYDPNPA